MRDRQSQSMTLTAFLVIDSSMWEKLSFPGLGSHCFLLIINRRSADIGKIHGGQGALTASSLKGLAKLIRFKPVQEL